ncbi:hypothetical protein NX059_010589 [Plenodomus lindquistii]|nr:hypothetical protein NX059_010589 [Plenodomus lindquistii]
MDSPSMNHLNFATDFSPSTLMAHHPYNLYEKWHNDLDAYRGPGEEPYLDIPLLIANVASFLIRRSRLILQVMELISLLGRVRDRQ